jgi:hypothetical protein
MTVKIDDDDLKRFVAARFPGGRVTVNQIEALLVEIMTAALDGYHAFLCEQGATPAQVAERVGAYRVQLEEWRTRSRALALRWFDEPFAESYSLQ